MQAHVHKTGALGASLVPEGRSSRAAAVDSTRRTVHLQGGQHLRLRGRVGWTVRALAGTAWITQDGDIRDVVLETGEGFVLDREGDALVSALGAASVCMTPDGDCRPASPKAAPAISGALRAAQAVAA